MADTNFIPRVTTIVATWLQDVNDAIYRFVQAGTGAITRTLENKLSDLPITPQDFGAVGDGVTDDSAAIVAAFATLTDNSSILFPPGVYLCANTQPNPYSAAANQHVAVLNGKSNVLIIGQGATLKMMTEDNSVQGAILFYDCVNCSASGLRMDGSYTGGVTWTNSFYGVQGLSTDITIEGDMEGGYAIARVSERQGDNTGTAADKPARTKISGNAVNNRYGIDYLFAGHGHEFDITAKACARGIFFTGVSGVQGKLRASDSVLNDLMFGMRSACVNEHIQVDFQRASTAVTSVNFTVTDNTACRASDIKISGAVASITGTAVVLARDLGTAAVVIEDIDLSELWIESTQQKGVSFAPSNAANIIRRITLPKRIKALSHCVELDNTNGASMSKFNFPDGWWYDFFSGAAGSGIFVFGGTVSDVTIGAGECDGTNTSATSLTLSLGTCDRLTLGKMRVTGGTTKGVRINGAKNVAPYVIDHYGRGFVYYGAALADAADISGLETLIFTSGSTSFNSFSQCCPGQRITFVCKGGTPTFTDGANIQCAGGANFVGTSEDTITFVCVNDPTVGPITSSILYEVGRSVN